VERCWKLRCSSEWALWEAHFDLSTPQILVESPLWANPWALSLEYHREGGAVSIMWARNMAAKFKAQNAFVIYAIV